ncbi:hypothetical protein CAOG_04307 [Capsaspora owczarzaki ATCC 30864]|uniref:HTH cro/C1-type domain-containing protein n=1 Tax=Capsaspora owczarzaki (strain ATCC 30864) TaxID=595528 RepID=A0A0D2X318_CAPO3|nr:hypothetical protein CAOG_04307 [Capsaspora owczarzaki ATCC 30864]KJE93534.1 hypothetical protein CAOG_004307 [Capsaspora owczarzaki ATCC 30864]|eukprot:XP_004348135.1 hypothetical protein CAOG_04307 [Capsaspora owczarzaki ATCC 30864]
MSDDWDNVTYLRKKTPSAGQARSNTVINTALRQGAAVDTTKKFSAATNKNHSTDLNTARLDRETEELHHSTVGMEVGRLIQQGRAAKEWTRKDLAVRVNEKQEVVAEYENGTAIPNQQVLAKIERAVGIKLRGKDKGTPLGSK